MKQVRVHGIMPMVRNLGIFFSLISLLFFTMFAGQFPDREDPYVPALSTGYYMEKGRSLTEFLAARLGSDVLKAILRAELPVLAAVEGKQDPRPSAGAPMVKVCLNLLTGVRLEDPLSYLKSEIPMMDVTPVTADSFDETAVDEITEEPAPETANPPVTEPVIENSVKSDAPLVALYNTHTSETYELTDGLAHLRGKAGGVSVVTAEIQKTIQESYGIGCKYVPALHDLAFNKSYAESQKTVAQLVKDHPDLEMLLDIHRDGSMTREQSLVQINGHPAARILFVVGTDARAEHPKWRSNLEFTRKIAAKMDAMYPGLSRGLAIKQGRYNQQFSTRALLVEVGSSKNKLEEAVYSGKLLANVIVAVLNDMRAGQE